jgi:hypothetical protein
MANPYLCTREAEKNDEITFHFLFLGIYQSSIFLSLIVIKSPSIRKED